MNRSSRRRPATLLVLAAALAAGCGSTTGKGASAKSSSAPPASPAASSPASGPASAPTAAPTQSPVPATSSAAGLSGPVTVFAAASLTGSFRTLAGQFEAAHPGVHVTLEFAASSTLAQQIIQGAPADVFASASPKNMAQVTKAKDAANPTTFARNTAEIAVAPSAAGRVTSVADLAKPGLKVALCQPQVPCGALARTVLANAKVSVKPVTLGLDVKSTLAYVTSGAADAAVVYVTDVKAAGSKVRPVPIPAAENASTAYPIATVTPSKHAALAAAFVAYVESAMGEGVLRQAGFSGP